MWYFGLCLLLGGGVFVVIGIYWVIMPSACEQYVKKVFANEIKSNSQSSIEAKKKEVTQRFLIMGAICLIIGVLIVVPKGSSSSSSSYSSTPTSVSVECKSCHRKFSDSANISSIHKRNMCENCYNNFKWGQSQLE